MEKAYWRKYSEPSSYNTPWPLADGWDDCADNEVFMLDMSEERCLGASSGQQETAAVTFHTLTEVEATVMERYLGKDRAVAATHTWKSSTAEFYTECTGAGRNPSKDFGTYLPSWTEIRDLSNGELITIVDRERKRHLEVNNHAYDHPQCSKVTLPDGRTVDRL
ncbi:unnamed protein product [Prunus brigantina]